VASLGVFGELAVVAGALVVSLVIWAAIKARGKRRNRD
jgi:hypothetical protein